MPDDRRCPLCGADCTHFATRCHKGESGPVEWAFKYQQCGNVNCRLLCRLWDQIEQLQQERNEARADVERLNQMLRETGYGQGQIDAYAAQCEEIERLRNQRSMDEVVDKYFADAEKGTDRVRLSIGPIGVVLTQREQVERLLTFVREQDCSCLNEFGQSRTDGPCERCALLGEDNRIKES